MNCKFHKFHEVLYKSNKPYQYVGGEILAINKSFDDAKLRFAFVFPDKYEIGISNLGVRILYDLINKHPDFMADRAYAPEPDFKPEFLYGLESKRPIKDFDIVGFSLQYELSYPTVLKLLEMSGVAYRNDARSEQDPIIVAGGPCTYNPLPMAEFIDAFIIGDGEYVNLAICQKLLEHKNLPRNERIKKLAEIEGVWVPACGKDKKIKKCAVPLEYETALKSYPIPFSSSVHDRAVVEIRRGCGRMCRFCQPGHVTLPVREREAEEIIQITKELVHNTGYDEYSLLSLSSNDYSNIREVIKELAIDFNDKKISVSLPSQRIDGFNLELANLVQSVRKSTMTLAPEAGSQRLRNVIKKNISKEQILDAVLTLYKNGWSRLKFYFITGLPTETKEDLDEMASLLDEIKRGVRALKKEFGLKHGFDITCTLSIFVPKPFTPFQWCPQFDLDTVTEHIHYLKDKTAHIKGLKINYHEKYISMLEAVLTRGDESLCKYIEALYKKGCYLDAWDDYFDKRVWFETADETNIDLKSLAQKTYKLEEALPWDFIDTGLDKAWLQNEYRDALQQPPDFNLQPTCEHKCVQCGVCKNLNLRKILAKPFKASDKAQQVLEKKTMDPNNAHRDPNIPIYKYRLKISKTGMMRYFSHLDWQNTFFKALARTDLNVVYSLGFNPSMKVSMGIALPLFCESDGELVDIELYDNLPEEEIKTKLEKALCNQAVIKEVKKIPRNASAIDICAHWAEYRIRAIPNLLYNPEKIRYNIDKVLSSDEILLTKKNKKGLEKTINIKTSIHSYEYKDDCLFIILKTGQGSELPAVRADELMKLIAEDVLFDIKRIRFFDEQLKEM